MHGMTPLGVEVLSTSGPSEPPLPCESQRLLTSEVQGHARPQEPSRPLGLDGSVAGGLRGPLVHDSGPASAQILRKSRSGQLANERSVIPRAPRPSAANSATATGSKGLATVPRQPPLHNSDFQAGSRCARSHAADLVACRLAASHFGLTEGWIVKPSHNLISF